MARIEVNLRDAPAGLVLETIFDTMLAGFKSITDRFINLEAVMADLAASVTRLEAAVRGITDGSLAAALEEERAANAALVTAAAAADATRLELAASEDAEDVVQNADLQAAVDRVNAAQAVTDEASGRIDQVSAALEAMPHADEPTPVDPTPVDPAPVDPPVVDEPVPTDPVVNPGNPDDPNPPQPGGF